MARGALLAAALLVALAGAGDVLRAMTAGAALEQQDANSEAIAVSAKADMAVTATTAAASAAAEPAARQVHIGYCTSNVAMQYRQALLAAFPDVEVTLAKYPPPPHKALLANAVQVAQLAGVALSLGGDYAFRTLGLAQPPAWYQAMMRNRLGYAAGFWLGGNMFINSLVSTGAFEVSLDGQQVFSKLQEGKVPSELELTMRVGNALHQSLVE
eukprot:SM000028S10150  [mRNA]  locus=s28:614400:615493:- [translate_table: standard]